MKDHFKGKPVVEHLREARAKGALASREIHGTEIPGHLSAGADSAKETAFLFSLLFLLLSPHHLFFLALGWLVWKIGRSALLGWTRLERVHRLIEEEQWEIEHNRTQEKEELTALYEAKGLKGKLLIDVVEVLMADDNRLLTVMLEEELGLTLEQQEHPLKQALGAGVGVCLSFTFLWVGNVIGETGGLLTGAFLAIALSSYISARVEKNRTLEAVIWNCALAAFAAGIVYELSRLL